MKLHFFFNFKLNKKINDNKGLNCIKKLGENELKTINKRP